jgi:uncharacterized membrane protein YbhN (UPF0104 family)
MTEKELGRALLKLDATQLSGTPDARQLTWRILERDRRRVQLLSGLTIGVWIFAAVVILLVLVGSGYLFPLREARLQAEKALEREREARLQLEKGAGKITAAPREPFEENVKAALHKATLAAIAVLTLAALCTVFLVFASRRATLRQFNASLVEISEQLKELRQALGK